MKRLIIFFLLITGLAANAQKDTVIFLGVNGRLVQEETAARKKVLDARSGSRFVVKTYEKTNNKWLLQYQEKARRGNSGAFIISVKGTGMSGTFSRKYERMDNGLYRFSEVNSDRLVKSGYSKILFPLVLHGEVTEYYDNGQMKSKSVYSNNELVSNENWFENGEEYLDNIFYSADSEPLYSRGMPDMHRHVKQAFLDSGLDISNLEGSMLMGFVVMEDGSIRGIRILKGLNPELSNICILALQSLKGTWTPARLDGNPVRYFQLFPINFIQWETRFESVEFNGSMLHWESY
jgi:hypothetical protein